MNEQKPQKPEDREVEPPKEEKREKPAPGATDEQAFRAATHSTDDAPPGQHPGHAFDAREVTNK